MREIGGYIELDRYCQPMLYENALAFNCGRNCLAWLIEKKHIRKLTFPYFLCDTAWEVCAGRNVQTRFYHVGEDLMPRKLELASDEWLYLVNYYGQLPEQFIINCVKSYGNVIVDNSQAYFSPPQYGAYTIYSCRKYFGVADGAFLAADVPDAAELSDGYDALPMDSSCEHMHFLLGRFEHDANRYYAEYVRNNERFHNVPVMRMSPLTRNLLHGIRYEDVRSVRTKNFRRLASRLGAVNRLTLRAPDGPFAYPFWTENGDALRKKLIAQNIYIPLLWPNVAESMAPGTTEYDLAVNILPLPCDQRYGAEEMKRICEAIGV